MVVLQFFVWFDSETKMYFKKGKAKIEIAIAKGKKQYDKRKLRAIILVNGDKFY